MLANRSAVWVAMETSAGQVELELAPTVEIPTTWSEKAQWPRCLKRWPSAERVECVKVRVAIVSSFHRGLTALLVAFLTFQEAGASLELLFLVCVCVSVCVPYSAGDGMSTGAKPMTEVKAAKSLRALAWVKAAAVEPQPLLLPESTQDAYEVSHAALEASMF